MRYLYHLPLSPFSRKVRLVLAEKRLPFELRVEKVWERRPEYLELNPAGTVPTLIEDNGLVIVSKDSDFSQRSSLLGGAPKVIWLRIGNCTTTRADFVLRNTAERIQAFLESSEESCLVLSHPRRA